MFTGLYNDYKEILDSPVRQTVVRVSLYSESDTLLCRYMTEDFLKEFTLERVGDESKFFGFGIPQKLNVKLMGTTDEFTTNNYLTIAYRLETDEGYRVYTINGNFYITEVNKNERSGEISITAYDKLYKAQQHTISELPMFIEDDGSVNLQKSYTVRELITACAEFLGIADIEIKQLEDSSIFDTAFENGANFEGSETLREVLDAAAEFTQTIYYIDLANLIFKRLDRDGEPVYTIDKEKYFELDSKTNRRLSAIVSTNELGDSVTASLGTSGTTQYIRNNPFIELREDMVDILDGALANVGGTTINQFSCEWRGNWLIELGDKIALETKIGMPVSSYLINDVITYNGALKEKTKWEYEENNSETTENPTSLGEVLKETYARVNKADKRIEMVASETADNTKAISDIEITTGEISASVTDIQTNLGDSVKGINENITELESKVNASMTSAQVKLEIEKTMSDGVNKVKTATGYTFDDGGMTVDKTDSNTKTQITENGMTVRDKAKDEDVLTANNAGVNARNLHAVTYLIIGKNSRLEDYDDTRTGCFWLGGGF